MKWKLTQPTQAHSFACPHNALKKFNGSHLSYFSTQNVNLNVSLYLYTFCSFKTISKRYNIGYKNGVNKPDGGGGGG